MERTEATVEMLNDLVQINNDRIQGFERALKAITDEEQDIRDLFINCIGDSQQFKMELATEVQALSKHKDVDNTTTISGSLHRTWIELKTVFTGPDTKSILEECEFGEDAILKSYIVALDMEELPEYIREMLTLQKQKLEYAHDEIRSLRDNA